MPHRRQKIPGKINADALAAAVAKKQAALGLTTAHQLAAAVGVGQETIRDLLNGGRTPNRRSLAQYAKFLGLPRGRFLEQFALPLAAPAIPAGDASVVHSIDQARVDYEQAVINHFRGRIPIRLLQLLQQVEHPETFDVIEAHVQMLLVTPPVGAPDGASSIDVPPALAALARRVASRKKRRTER